MNGYDFSRTMVIGCAGSGKTTFANAFAQRTNRTAVHLDKVLWQSNWVEMPFEQRKAIHDRLIAKDEWLIDGMWGTHVADRFNRATAVIFLDYPTHVCLCRAFWRFVRSQNTQRPDLAEGCVEKNLDKVFLKRIKSFRKEMRPKLYQMLKNSDGKTVLIFTSPRQATKFLKQL